MDAIDPFELIRFCFSAAMCALLGGGILYLTGFGNDQPRGTA